MQQWRHFPIRLYIDLSYFTDTWFFPYTTSQINHITPCVCHECWGRHRGRGLSQRVKLLSRQWAQLWATRLDWQLRYQSQLMGKHKEIKLFAWMMTHHQTSRKRNMSLSLKWTFHDWMCLRVFLFFYQEFCGDEFSPHDQNQQFLQLWKFKKKSYTKINITSVPMWRVEMYHKRDSRWVIS